MEYNITFEGNNYELPPYSLEIAEKIEKIKSKMTLASRCDAIYRFLRSIFGTEQVKDILGEYAGIDPNRTEILFSAICEAYSEPVSTSNVQRVAQIIKDAQLDKVEAIIKAIDMTQGLE